MKSRLLRTLTGIFALAATAGTLEYTGYNAFDREDGTNFICDIDPSCHYLTEGEIDFATQVYGDSIDFTNVKKFSRAWFFFPEERAHAPNGNMYFPYEDFPEDFSNVGNGAGYAISFIHELGHVKQTQGGRNLVMEFLAENWKQGGNYNHAYFIDEETLSQNDVLSLEQEARLYSRIGSEVFFIQRLGDRNGGYPFINRKGKVITEEFVQGLSCEDRQKAYEYFRPRLRSPFIERCDELAASETVFEPTP